jgi:polyhydroxybutyrate depolymerase
MRGFLISCGILALGCSAAESGQAFTLPGSERAYRVLTPGDPSQPSAVLFALHAFSTEPQKFGRSFSLREIAKERNWLLIVPEGRRNRAGQPFWNASGACCDAERTGPDDIAYLRAVLADVKRRYAVDSKRVYALGVSNGGFMAHRWACTPHSELTGFISISGAGPGPLDAPCTPTAKVRVLQIHGSHDAIIHYDGGELNGARYPGARTTLQPWLSANGCAPEPIHSVHKTLFNLTAARDHWRCTGAPVALWRVLGGGHRMPLGRGFMQAALGFLEDR